ncbi:MAG TPA: methyl-accepting chemotaxis protein [Acetobacteraceae bacterium]|jgi:methyl-accepting chemotaxis protein
MPKSIRAKMLAWLVILTGVLAGLAIGAWMIGQREVRNAAAVVRGLDSQMLPAVELLRLAKDIRYNVVQVQQFLTDASATRDPVSVADDFKQTASQAADFDSNVSRSLELAQNLHQADAEHILQQARALFPAYYQTGQAMARRYVADGTAAGNKLMEQFDPQSDKINDLTAQLEKIATAQLDASVRNLRGEMRVAADQAHSTSLAGPAASVGLIVLCMAFGVTLMRGMLRPLRGITAVMSKLAAGDTAVTVPSRDAANEIGAMARAVEVFKQNAVARVRLEAEHAEHEVRATEEKRTALVGMAERIETETRLALEKVGARTSTIAATAEEMSVSSIRTEDSARGAATAAEHALANAQTVASAAEQLNASIREIGGQMGQSIAVAGRAVAAGGDARTTMETLHRQVGRIGEVANIISDIAAKTNLLALNATIEAARAGDAGKGFAVVASEVKQLATQTARSTEEITRHIGEVRGATDASVAAVKRIESTIDEINAIAGSIAAAVEQQGAATAEIARNVTQTAGAVNEMSQRIGEVSAEAGRTGQRSTKVRDDTAGLNTLVDELRHSVIRVVRSATADVDRRHAIRYPAALPCRVTVPGLGTQPAVTADLSEGGASIRGGPALSPGSRGTLQVERIGMTLPFVVRAADDEVSHLAFELDAETARHFVELLEGVVMQRAA